MSDEKKVDKSAFERIKSLLGSVHETRMKGIDPQWSMSDSFGRFAFFYFGVLVILLSGLVFITYSSYEASTEIMRVEKRELMYWQNAAEQFPRHPDTFYTAAYHAYRLGHEKMALSYLEEALSLDGSFEAALELQEEILRGD